MDGLKYLLGALLRAWPLLLLCAGYSEAQSLTVTQQKTITITTTRSPTIKVVSTTANVRDFVAVYKVGAIVWDDWRYVASGTQVKAAQGAKTGTIKFANLKPGVAYELKLYALTDAGVTTLKDTFPFTVAPALTAVETEGTALTVTRRASNEPDQLNFVVDGATGTATIPKDTVITVKP